MSSAIPDLMHNSQDLTYISHYGPGFTQFFLAQNEKIANGTIKIPGAHYIHLDTLGLVNACIDSIVQDVTRIEQAYNSTYPIQLINESTYDALMLNWTRPGGTRDQLLRCKEIAAEKDPNDTGIVEEVNAVCANVTYDPADIGGVDVRLFHKP